MTDALNRLIPGIQSMFRACGLHAAVSEVDNHICIEITSSTGRWERRFPFPSTNKELAIPLKEWREEILKESNK